MVELHFDQELQALRCTFHGRLDTIVSSAVTEKCTAEFNQLKERANLEKIVFDLGGVNYVASSFLRLCLVAAKAVAKGNFSIVNTDPQVLKVFKIAGLSSMLNVS